MSTAKPDLPLAALIWILKNNKERYSILLKSSARVTYCYQQSSSSTYLVSIIHNDLLQSLDDEEVLVLIVITQVSGFEEAVLVQIIWRWHADVPSHEDWTPQTYFAALVWTHSFTGFRIHYLCKVLGILFNIKSG